MQANYGIYRTSLYRYQDSVRAYLSAAPYDDAAERLAADAVLAAAETMSDPADLINRVVEALQAASTDLPAFSTLDWLPHDTASKVWAPAKYPAPASTPSRHDTLPYGP